MGLDIRLPIGLMFSLIGLFMIIYGLATGGDAQMYQASLGININFWWGLVMLVFGSTMLGFALAGRAAEKAGSADPARTPHQ